MQQKVEGQKKNITQENPTAEAPTDRKMVKSPKQKARH